MRLLFLFFAEDALVFGEKDVFKKWLKNTTIADKDRLAERLATLFQELDNPHIGGEFSAFRYVNGGVFARTLKIPTFFGENIWYKIHDLCAHNDWSHIQPAIFGAMFQGLLEDEEKNPNKKTKRDELGAHYTSEKNILRAIDPLFLADLWEQYRLGARDLSALVSLRAHIATLKILDPACGCGNFLIVAYRELRLLEAQIVRQYMSLGGSDTAMLSKGKNGAYSHLSMSHFCGIEIDPNAAEIAKTAMWLVDHQMNRALGDVLGVPYVRLPLNESANIVHANALRTDWAATFGEVNYIVGNPPFLGHHLQTPEQKADQVAVCKNIPQAGILDFVSSWFVKGAEYTNQHDKTKVAFVSTNSITQGEQVGILWREVLSNNISIDFAHRTFQWSNDAKGVAAVHCVVIGFSKATKNKLCLLVEYPNIKEDGVAKKVSEVTPYLIEGKTVLIENRIEPLADVPEMRM